MKITKKGWRGGTGCGSEGKPAALRRRRILNDWQIKVEKFNLFLPQLSPGPSQRAKGSPCTQNKLPLSVKKEKKNLPGINNNRGWAKKLKRGKSTVTFIKQFIFITSKTIFLH